MCRRTFSNKCCDPPLRMARDSGSSRTGSSLQLAETLKGRAARTAAADLTSAIGRPASPSRYETFSMAGDRRLPRPRWPFSRLSLLVKSGHWSALSSRPPSLDSPRSVHLPKWLRCATSRSMRTPRYKWTGPCAPDGFLPLRRNTSVGCPAATLRGPAAESVPTAGPVGTVQKDCGPG
jgi:hypothetical protein